MWLCSTSPRLYRNGQISSSRARTKIFIISWKCYDDAIKWILLYNSVTHTTNTALVLLLLLMQRLLLPSSGTFLLHFFFWFSWIVLTLVSNFECNLILVADYFVNRFALYYLFFGVLSNAHGQRISGNLAKRHLPQAIYSRWIEWHSQRNGNKKHFCLRCGDGMRPGTSRPETKCFFQTKKKKKESNEFLESRVIYICSET